MVDSAADQIEMLQVHLAVGCIQMNGGTADCMADLALTVCLATNGAVGSGNAYSVRLYKIWC